jgi:hypothetical protein
VQARGDACGVLVAEIGGNSGSVSEESPGANDEKRGKPCGDTPGLDPRPQSPSGGALSCQLSGLSPIKQAAHHADPRR